ncbi:MAG: extracellular factor (EF) 3-hydroxypalmitic acid methyl ester biosynthesis protein [Kiritimatiellia bacterium]|jgi:extracellular factor (EF) 3-hydroxypalmitic acid methyl ester biosynthesis protein
MQLLDLFDEQHRTLFESAGEPFELPAGGYMLRRGEPGGDIFLLEEGKLEVVDTRSTLSAILAVLQPGSIVGEIAFLDDSPRSADVRAQTDVRAVRWAKNDVLQLLSRHPTMAGVFYQAIARTTALRMRSLSQAATTSHNKREASDTIGLEQLATSTQDIANRAKESMLEAESVLRHDPGQQLALRSLDDGLDTLQMDLSTLFEEITTPAAAAQATRNLTRELHPYLTRSALAERCASRSAGVSGAAEVMAHVLVDTPGGDGLLGELIDRWLLDRPTLVGLRAAQRHLAGLTAKHLPVHRNRHVMQLNAGTGSLVAALNHHLALSPTILTVVDQSRDVLAFLDAGMTLRPRQVHLQTAQENLAQLALGRSKHHFPKQDVIIVHSLLEYMPDRIALSMLKVVRNLLNDEGTVVFSALMPSEDQTLLDRLLSWPTVRRSATRLERLVERADLVIRDRVHDPTPVMVYAASPAS